VANIKWDTREGGPKHRKIETLAADEIAGVKYPIVKVGVGESGAFTPIGADDPLPVSISEPEAGQRDLLQQILTELQRMNLYLSSMTGEEFTEPDTY